MKLWLLLLFSLTSPAFSQIPGTRLWTVTLPQEVCTSPAIAPDGTIYIGTGPGPAPGPNGSLCSVSTNGHINWILHFPQGVRTSPSIGLDGRIYVASYDGQLRIVDPTSNYTSVPVGGYVFASPAIGSDGTVYLCSASNYFNKLFAFTPDGAVKWAFSMTPLADWTNLEQFATAQCSSPAIGPDGTVYVGSVDGNVYAVKPDGSTNWVFPLEGIATPEISKTYASPAIGPDGTIYIGADNGVGYALNPSGSAKWKVPLSSDWVESSAVVAKDETVYFATGSRTVCALDPNGNLKWSFTNNLSFSASPALGSDGSLYANDITGTLFALSPSGSILWRKPTGYTSCSSPALSPNGTIYVGADQTLVAFYGTNQLMASSWPMFRADPKHTARSMQRSLGSPQLLSDGNFHFTLNIETGRTYQIEYSANLVDWSELATFVSDTCTKEISDLTATNSRGRTYRLRTSTAP